MMGKQFAASGRLRVAITTLIASISIPLSISALADTGERNAQRARISKPRLRELGSIGQLKEIFQSDAGKVRLVVLVSPT